MKLKTTLKRVYLPVLTGVILLSVVFRIAALFASYNFDTGFYDKKILINIASVIVVSGSVFMFTYAFSGTKKNKLIADFSTPATYVPTGALLVAMLFFAVLTHIASSKTDFSIREFMALPGATFPLLLKYVSANMSSFILSLMAPMACLAVGYFILTACVLKRSSSLRAFFGTANVLFLAFYTSYLYFDTTTLARNAPNKIVDQMAFLFAALFFLYEIRISLGREKWNLYMAFGFIAAVLTAYSSIPSLTVYFINGEIISNNIQENVLSFALFVFIISRITLAAFLKEDKESESISAIREYTAERSDYIFAKEEAARRAYMELYAELNAPEEDEENSDYAEQLSLDETIDSVEDSDEERSTIDTYDTTEANNEETNTSEPDDVEFIQESIQFEEYATEEGVEENVNTKVMEETAEEITEADTNVNERNI